MKRMVFMAAAVLAAVACAGASARAAAPSLSELRKDLKEKKAAHAALTKKTQQLGAEVTTLKKNLVRASRELQGGEDALAETQARLRGLQQKKASCLENLYREQRTLGGLVSAARKYTQAPPPEMFLQNTPVEAARAATAMKAMIPLVDARAAGLRARLVDLDRIEADIQSQLQVQMRQKKTLSEKQNDLADLLEERKKIYRATDAERAEQEKEVERLTRESRNLEELMQNVKKKARPAPPDAALPANILLPVRGTVETAFGEKDALGADSRGITFRTRPGAQVVVPLPGTVKFAGAFQNYRQILIVEHAGGYHSLIAGLARISTVAGATLDEGEPVGTADTGDEPKIYYELRQNGKPVNPRQLGASQKNRKQEKG